MKRIKGFTLFEIILVMLVMAVAVVALITFTSRKTQETAAEQLGYRLFQYGLAVTDYARQNPEGYDPDNSPPAVIYGYEWLQEATNPETEKPFLGENFSFNVPPLRINNVQTDSDEDEDGSIIKTILTINETGQGTYEVVVDLIELGTVTKPTTTTQRGESNDIFMADLSLAGAAAQYATTYRNREGAAVIEYRLQEDFSDNPEKAHIVGEPKSDVGLSDYWLLTSGENFMQGPIEFNPTVVSTNRRIGEVDAIHFSDTGEREMTGLMRLELADPKSNIKRVKGFRTLATESIILDENGVPEAGVFMTYDSTLLTPANSICFLSMMQAPQNTAATCNVYPDSNNDNRWRLEAKRTSNPSNHVICEARCLIFYWN